MSQAYEGYLENGRFYPIGQPPGIQGRRRVILTVVEEKQVEPKETQQAKAWREFFEAINGNDEKVPDMFERVNFSRETEV